MRISFDRDNNRFLKPVNVRKVESCLLIEDELSLDGGLADYSVRLGE